MEALQTVVGAKQVLRWSAASISWARQRRLKIFREKMDSHVEWHRQECGQSPTKKLRELVNQPMSPVIMAGSPPSPPLVEVGGVWTNAVQEEDIDVDLWLTSPFPRRVISLCVMLSKLRCRKLFNCEWRDIYC